MKKSSILDFFKCQSEISKINCPACNTLVIKSKLNEHLDYFCSSTKNCIDANTSKHNGFEPESVNMNQSKLKQKITSNKLNLKTQRKRNVKSHIINKTETKVTHDTENDIIFLDEIPASSMRIPSNPLQQNVPEKSSLNREPSCKTNGCSPKRSSELVESVSNKNVECIKTLKTKKSLKRCISSSNSSTLQSKYMKSDCSNLESNNSISMQEPEKTFLIDNKLEASSDVKSINFKESSSECEDVKLAVSSSCSNIFIKDNILKSESIKHFEADNHSVDIEKCLEDASAFSELSDSNEKDVNEGEKKVYTPYYIANFKHILAAVMSNEENKILFNEEDMDFVNSFKSLTDASQKMYVRLFQRKYKWLRIDKINYPDITSDSFAVLEELAKSRLVESGSSDIDLETAINLLSLPESKCVAKHFNLNSGKNKTEIKSMLLKHSKQHKSVFFTNGRNGIASMILKKVKQTIGPCYRLSLLPKRLFTRILMLFNLPMFSEDDDDAAAGGQQQQLLTLLQINKGELTFPEYKQTREITIFVDRDELIRYEEARQLENDILNAVEYKKFEEAKELYIEAKEEYEDQCMKSFATRATSLPVFLKRYTSFHVYIRCMTQGVEILQRLRQYKEAVSLLRKLLKQKVFCQDYKGRWYDRLALNLEQHLKKPQEALEAIKKAIQDKNVRVGHRYSLLTRALRITKSLDDDDDFKKQLLNEADVIDAPKVVIKGRLCPRSILGRRHVFISSSSALSCEDDVTVLGVEQLSIEHYKEEGYSEGIHGEGSTFISLYALLFWDIIYDGNVPDVFISPYQTHPLDLNSDMFFMNRKKQITSHLKTLRIATTEALKEIIKSSWENNHGRASLVTWDRFTDLEHVLGLVSCLGNAILSGICERLARDFRFTRSGVPDLVVWNPESLKVKIVEVKGPGDKLSSKQILWLDYLIKLGADAEVCLVEAVASKKLGK